MKCEGSFVFKSIEEKEGGEFVNERGQKVSYNPTYRVTVDDCLGDKIVSRTFKFPKGNATLFDKFKRLNPYDNVIISFNVELYQSSVKLVPLDVICEQEETEEE